MIAVRLAAVAGLLALFSACGHPNPPRKLSIAAAADLQKSLLFRLGTADSRTVAAAGYRGFRRGKTIVVPGFTNKLGAFSSRLAPRIVVRKFVRLLQS